jgi:hypothetical protein
VTEAPPFYTEKRSDGCYLGLKNAMNRFKAVNADESNGTTLIDRRDRTVLVHLPEACQPNKRSDFLPKLNELNLTEYLAICIRN